MHNEALTEFANELKSAREEKGIELAQIASKTRIELKYLEKIEAGDFTFMPEVYIKAFVKEYAEAIGLDSADTVKKYKTIVSGTSEAEAAEDGSESGSPVTEFDSIETERAIPSEGAKKNNQLAYFAIVFLVITALVIVYFAFLKDSAPEFIKGASVPQIEQPAAQERFKEESKPATKLAATQNKTVSTPVTEGPLKVVIEATSRVWFRVTLDKNVTEEFMLDSAHSKEFSATSEFDFLIGDASAVKFKLNGKGLSFNGEKGKVKKVVIDQSGIKN